MPHAQALYSFITTRSSDVAMIADRTPYTTYCCLE